MKSTNPVLNENRFKNQLISLDPNDIMTYNGSINKVCFLLFIVISTFVGAWYISSTLQNPVNYAVLIGASVLGLIVAFVISFFPKTAPFLAPIYATVEGLWLGALSFMFNSIYPGIVFQAVSITFGIFFAMLVIFRLNIIPVTQKFRAGIVAATFGVVIVYVVTMLLGMFGIQVPFIFSSGIIGIGFSCFVIVIATLNLLLDFDFIQKGVENSAPKYYEWFAAFGLIVTIVWLYLEILRLLSILNRK